MDVLNRTTKELRTSANTPEYPLVDWIHSPDLSAVAGYPSKYWSITGDVVSLMSAGEMAAVDAAEEAAAILDERTQAKVEIDRRLLKAFAEVVRAEINILRTQHGLADRTAAQLRTALMIKIDEV